MIINIERGSIKKCFHAAWADDDRGTNLQTEEYPGALYIGHYQNDSDVESTDPLKYTWHPYNGTKDLINSKIAEIEETIAHMWIDAEGVHIAEKTEDEFKDKPEGGNILIKPNMMSIRNGLNCNAMFSDYSINIGNYNGLFAVLNRKGMQFYDNDRCKLMLVTNSELGATAQYGMLGEMQTGGLYCSLHGDGTADNEYISNVHLHTGDDVDGELPDVNKAYVRIDANSQGGQSSCLIESYKNAANLLTLSHNNDHIFNVFKNGVVMVTNTISCDGHPLSFTETVTATVSSTNALSNAIVSATIPTHAGFKAVGVVGTCWASGTRQNFFNMWRSRINAGKVEIGLVNLHPNSAASGTIEITVLYVQG